MTRLTCGEFPVADFSLTEFTLPKLTLAEFALARLPGYNSLRTFALVDFAGSTVTIVSRFDVV